MSQTSIVQPQPSVWDYIQPFVTGGISGAFASSVLFPIDTTKVRIQARSEELGKAGQKGNVSFSYMAKEIYKTTGLRGFYKGLDSSIARQLVFSTARLGIYKTMTDNIKAANNGVVSSANKIKSAITAGFIATVLANPTDVAMVRMQADPTLPVAERRNYKNVYDALTRIVKEEGYIAWWKGSFPTIVRGIVLNLFILAPYDEIKERINNYTNTKDLLSTQIIACGGAGFLSSFFSLPFDNIKTKLQKMKPDANGVLPYSGITDCFTKTRQREGFTRLWVGFGSYYSRTAPHVMITLVLMDFIARWSSSRNSK